MNDIKKQEGPSVGFLVMAFTDEKAGDEALKAMQEAKKQKKFYFENAAVIRQDAAGKVHYRETGDMKTGTGAGVGALVGGVIGIFGGPAGVALGAGAGAALGAAVAYKDSGFRDESLKSVGKAMKPGTSAVTAITNDAFLRNLQKQVSEEEVRPFVDKLAAKISDRLNEGKNVALGILLDPSGLVYKEVAADEKSAEVIGLAITDESVVASAAVITQDQVSYGMVAATPEVVASETGVVSKEGAIVVDDVVTKEGEVVMATAILPEESAKKMIAETEPAAVAVSEAKPAPKPALKKAAKKAAPAKKKPAKPALKKTAKKAPAKKKPAKPAPKKAAKKAAPVKKKPAKPAVKKTAKKKAPKKPGK